jgi:hypothetical protein
MNIKNNECNGKLKKISIKKIIPSPSGMTAKISLLLITHNLTSLSPK